MALIQSRDNYLCVTYATPSVSLSLSKERVRRGPLRILTIRSKFLSPSGIQTDLSRRSRCSRRPLLGQGEVKRPAARVTQSSLGRGEGFGGAHRRKFWSVQRLLRFLQAIAALSEKLLLILSLDDERGFGGSQRRSFGQHESHDAGEIAERSGGEP